MKTKVNNMKERKPNVPLVQIFHEVAEALEKTVEAIQRGYYYKSKKVTKKVT